MRNPCRKLQGFCVFNKKVRLDMYTFSIFGYNKLKYLIIWREIMNNYEFIHSITNEFKEICWDIRNTTKKQDGRQLYLNYFSTHSDFFNNSESNSKRIAIQSINIDGNDYLVLFDAKNLDNQQSIILNLDEIKGDKNSINPTNFSFGNNSLYLINCCLEQEHEQKQVKEIIKNIVSFKSIFDFENAIKVEDSNWNDYGYYQLIFLKIWDVFLELRVNPHDDMIRYLSKTIERPNDNYLCSLGSIEYYEFLKKYLPYNIREEWFIKTNDLAFNIDELDRISIHFKDHGDGDNVFIKNKVNNFFNNSFLRNTTIKEIKEIFHPLAISGIDKNQQDIKIVDSVNDEVPDIRYVFNEGEIKKGEIILIKNRNSFLPMNVYGIVGGNGSGKSHKILEIINGHINGDNKFSQIIHFSLSPFDLSIDISQNENDESVVFSNENYESVGFSSVKDQKLSEVLEKTAMIDDGKIKNELVHLYGKKYLDVNENFVAPSIEVQMKDSFIWYIESLLLDLIASDSKLKLWEESLNYFAFDDWANKIKMAFCDKKIEAEDFDLIKNLSSGQATILLYITKLVCSVNKGSLIIFDEPETFMHPPMMKSFIRAVSNIIQQSSAFCVIATHSPVVIQEIPHCNLYKIDSKHKIEPIHYKTYGQNLDNLYKNIYGVALQMTGYNGLLTERYKELLNSPENENVVSLDEILLKDDIQYLGDEAYLKYLIVKDMLETEIKKNEKSKL